MEEKTIIAAGNVATNTSDAAHSADRNGPDLIGFCQKAYVRGLYIFEKLVLIALFVFGMFLIITGLSRFSFAQTINIPAAADAVNNLTQNGDPSKLGEVLKGIAAEEKAADEKRDQGLFGLGPQQNVDYRETKCGTGFLLQILEGNFGAFLLVGATIAALISTWSGRYAYTFTILIFIAGSMILRSATEIFFFTDYSDVPNLLSVDSNCD